MLTLTPTSELDAINIMLGTIGESPVNSLGGDSGTADVSIARQVLREATIQVLEEGWHFNTEIDWPLQPTADTGEILLPANCIQVDTTGASAGVDIVARGNRLYDRKARSYVFASTLKVTMVILLEFTSLPQACRHYISIRAARVFQKRVVGSDALDAFTKEDESRARAALKRLDTNNADHSFLSGSWSVARILQR